MSEHHSFMSLFFSTKYPLKMLEQRYASLRVEFDSILMKIKGGDTTEHLTEELHKLFSADKRCWSTAYKIEQYITHICDEETLDVNLKGCLVQLKENFSSENYHHYERELKEIVQRKAGIKEKRSLLLRMQTELHWFYIKRSECRDYGLLFRMRITMVFLFGISLFLFSLLYCFYYEHMPTSSEMILLTITSGIMGAGFSMLVGVKNQLRAANMEDLKVMHRLSYILKRAFIGAGAATIAYFLIQSGLLSNVISSDLLPVLPVRDGMDFLQSYKNISVLIIWCFIAGFSEMFIPNLLHGVERRITRAKS